MWTRSLFFLLSCSLLAAGSRTNGGDFRKCHAPVQTISLVDLTLANVTEFRTQQSRMIEVLHHIDNVSRGRSVNFALIAYHRAAVPLTGLSTPTARNPDQVIGQLAALNPRPQAAVSRVRALRMAAEQIRLSGLDGAATVVLLADNGRISTDLTEDMIRAIQELRSLNATLFAVSGVENSKVAASDGYSAVYSRPQELPAFISTVDEAIGACLDDVQPSGVNSWTPRAFGLRSLAAPVDSPAGGCSGASEVELTILLDTSGSLHSTFERERQLAVELIEHLEPQEAIGRRIHVEVISFAEEPTVVVGRKERAGRSELLSKTARIDFTGGQTRIADGIQLALREWGARSKADVARVLVFISDGHGNDYWDHVRATAAELKEANVHVFVGSTSTDLDVHELRLWAGDLNRVFVGTRDKQLASAVISFIAGCLSADRKAAVKLAAEEPFLPLDSAAHKPQFDPPTAIPTVEGSGWNVHEEEDEVITRPPHSGDSTRLPPTTTHSTNEDDFSDLSADENPVFAQIKEWRRAAAAKLFRQTRAESSDEKEAEERNSTCATDLVLVIDASQSVEVDFRAQLMLAVEQVKKLPDANFDRDTRVAAVTFHSNATVELPLEHRPKAEVLEKLLAFKHYGGSTSAAKGVTAALDLIKKNRRSNARVVFLLISDGNSQDPWAEVVAVSDRLHSINADVRAATVSKLFFFRELEVYAGDEKRVYTGDRIPDFLDDTTISVLECRTVVSNRSVSITNSLELTATPSPDAVELLKEKLATSTPKEENEATNEQSMASEKPARTFEISAAKDGGIQFAARDQAVESSTLSANQSCNTNKLDLIIILDASTSRENVFEHQRELALSLIERLPISALDTHIALGINSFTDVPTLRQGLGLGRDREMVRKALESIKYVGGSTLTSKAIELAIAEMKKGRRPDAKAAIVLMNDGMSQDNWEDVVSISQRLEQSGAEVFGVALGDQVDLRELRLYVGNNEARLYRDGSTERFLQDVVSLLKSDSTADCPPPVVQEVENTVEDGGSCAARPLDLVVLFDSSADSAEENLTEPRLNANRFLVLDVLGSLPLGDRVRVAVFSFGNSPHLQFGFDRSQERSELFSAVEAIEATSERPAYARAFQRAAAYLQSKRRPNSNGLLLIVGDGRNTADTAQELKTAREKLGKDVIVEALHSGKQADLETLISFTGTAERFFGYEKNAQFAKSLQELAAQRNPSCIDDAPLGTTKSSSPLTSTKTTTKKAEEATTTEATSASEQPTSSTEESSAARSSSTTTRSTTATLSNDSRISEIESFSALRSLDIAAAPDADKRAFGGDKAAKLVRKLTTTTASPTSSSFYRTTTTTASASSSSVLRTTTKKASPKTTTADLTTTSKETTKTTVKSTTAKPTSVASTPVSTTTSASSSSSRTTTRRPPNSSIPSSTRSSTQRPSTAASTRRPAAISGCRFDVALILDTSGSVLETFEKERKLAIDLLGRLSLGEDAVRVSVLKFSAAVRVLHSFNSTQSNEEVVAKLEQLELSRTTTSIHSALLQAAKEFTEEHGARPGRAHPLAILFSDGYGEQDASEAARVLRQAGVEIYAIGVNREYPINRRELEAITGDKSRVYTDENIVDFYDRFVRKLRAC